MLQNADKLKEIKTRASFSWSKNDYEAIGDEPPKCLDFGLTEGESMNQEEVSEWIREEIQCLMVIREDSPKVFNEQCQYFLLNLQYIHSLGKIDDEEYLLLSKDKEIFNFGN